MLDKNLLDLLVCPICKSELKYSDPYQELICPQDKLAFPIVDNIPVMLKTEARELSSELIGEPS